MAEMKRMLVFEMTAIWEKSSLVTNLSQIPISCLSEAVKVNMHGSLVLGKDVVDTISDFLGNSYITGRRYLRSNKVDIVTSLTESSKLCDSLEICNDNLEEFVNQYVIILNKAIETILGGDLNPGSGNKIQVEESGLVFVEQFKDLLKVIKKLLKSANSKITDNSHNYIWTDIVKKISAKFQHKAVTFIRDEIHGNDISEIRKKLTQKIIIAIVAVEVRFLSKLCFEYNICAQLSFCTKALNTILERFETLSENNTRIFVKAFYESLLDTTFYSLLNDVTANEFQIILNDMHYSENISAKNILHSVHKTVKTRIECVNSKTDITKGFDVKLVYIILSDMDYITDQHKHDPFQIFTNQFLDWANGEGKLKKYIDQVINKIKSMLSNIPTEVTLKLINEVRVFLEITVDPE
ncbi:uncharacterized protein LOC131853464 [Achroia grisella]|uniref:uncharacterized protein LOC131853464 n=1 Tax=Achroia grisella TaxID=688607 RepID=UPI0027D2A64F|nr:uncharacterized protein LOC131853464 [Achroia grisella]